MEAEAFFLTIFLGMAIGAVCTMTIQWYGRRKVKAALKSEGIAPGRQTELLSNENEAMRGQMSRLEERLSVMERITTDSHMTLNQELERLR
jgi:truncated hemoglobin YjbI